MRQRASYVRVAVNRRKGALTVRRPTRIVTRAMPVFSSTR
jgi:hypothetical protein